MTSIHYLAPALAGTLALAATGDRRLRAAACALGGLAGLAVFATSDSLALWRGTEPEVASAFAGIGIAFAFALVVAIGDASGPVAAQAGIAGSSMILFAAGAWTVPSLLFWAVSTIAIAAMVAQSPRRATVWLALAVSDAALVGVVASAALEADVWTIPAIEGWRLWVLAGAAIVRSGSLPFSGQWPIETSTASAAAPLLGAGAFVLAARLLGEALPVLSGALIVVGLGAGVCAALWRFDMRLVGSFAIALMLGIALATPGARPAAAVAAVGTASVIGLWPSARGRGRATRGFVLAGVPPTVAFAGIAAAAAAAFDSSRSADGIDQIAWTGIASLLPVALAVAVALGAMTARRAPSEDFEAPAVIATWFVFATSVVGGLWLGAFIPAGDAAVGTPTRSLYLAALVAAGVAAWRTPSSGGQTRYGGADVLLSEAGYPRPIRTTALAIAGVAGAAALAGVIYLTLLGLQQGFLA